MKKRLRLTICVVTLTLPCLLGGCGRTEKTDNRAATTPTTPPAATPEPTPTPTPEIGVLKTSASGLQYEELEIGNGPRPLPGQALQIAYTGHFTDGKVFDKGVFVYKPLSDKTIKGWRLGILGDSDIPPMRVGGKRKIIVPPNLGYGSMTTMEEVPPNSTLVFELELRKIASANNLFNP